ncbi:MAG TPA: glycosyltransferase family 39 protein, partial [Terriglobales bacterium]|nr:glycosyltransferase family 39 protein [Terriglobales bacterium]
MAAAAALRSINLGSKSIWLDEAYRIYLARMPWHDFLQAVRHPFGANSVAYHLLLRYWLFLGSSEAAIRSLSIVFGVAIVLAIYKLGKELFDWQTGLIAAALAASNALLIRYSQEICAYTPATLLAVICSLYLWRAVKHNRRGDWIRYVIAATLMLYCHVLSIFVVAAQAGAAVFTRRRKLPLGNVISLAMIGAAFVPLAWCIAFGLPRPHAWTAAPGIRDLLHFVTALGGPDGLLLSTLLLLLMALGLYYSGDGSLGLEDRGWRY